MPSESPYDFLKRSIGKEIINSDWLEIDQERISLFSHCTGDDQWIHTDPDAAAGGPFGATVAQGFLILSLINYFRRETFFVPDGIRTSVNYGMNRVRFINPVRTGTRIKDRAVLLNVEKRSDATLLMKSRHTIEIEDEEKPACVAEVLNLLVP